MSVQGTPGTYLPSHAVYGPEGTKSSVGSISLGLPRQLDPHKPGRITDVRFVVLVFSQSNCKLFYETAQEMQFHLCRTTEAALPKGVKASLSEDQSPRY